VSALDDVLSRLDGVRETRRGWSARCPAHHDRSPSLSIARGRDGRALLKCFAGCRYDEIVSALGIDHEPRAARPGAWESPLVRARREVLDEARRQPWARPGTADELSVGEIYTLSDAIRRRRRAVDQARRIAAVAGDRPEARRLLATAAVVELEADDIETRLDGVLRC
jgi:hypothetical protein